MMPITFNETHAVPGNSFSFLLSQMQGNFHQQQIYMWQKLSGKSRAHLEQGYSSCCHSYSATHTAKPYFMNGRAFQLPKRLHLE